MKQPVKNKKNIPVIIFCITFSAIFILAFFLILYKELATIKKQATTRVEHVGESLQADSAKKQQETIMVEHAGESLQIDNDIISVKNFGNGVYYFNSPPYYRQNQGFGKILSIFRSQHQELELISIAGDVDGYNCTGYWVIFKTKPK